MGHEAAVLIPETMPRLRAIQVDGHALGSAMLISIATGLAQAWQAGRTRLSGAFKQAETERDHRRSRYRSALVVVEVALALSCSPERD
jgi:hypothetical protein